MSNSNYISTPSAMPATLHVDFDAATLVGPTRWVAALLSVPSLQFEVNEQGKLITRSVTDFFCSTDHHQRLQFSPGLVPWVTGKLTEEGWNVEVLDHRRVPRELVPDHRFVSGSGADGYLEAIRSNLRGAIEVASREELLDRLADACYAFPNQRILIMTGTKAAAWTIYQALRSVFKREVQLAKGKWSVRPGARIAVCPYAFIGQPDYWNIVLWPDAQQLYGHRAGDRARTAMTGPQRAFSFVRDFDRLTLGQQLAAQQFGGPVIHAQARSESQVHVLYYKVRRGVAVPAHMSGLERKRQQYWHNREFMDQLVRLARAADEGSLHDLQRLGRLSGKSCEVGRSGMNKIAILVESVEQGQALAANLPQWQLATRHITSPAGSGRLQIVTAKFLTEVELDADVLIRADIGNVSLPLSAVGDKPLLVIDLDERVPNGWTPDRQLRRQDFYQRMRWPVTLLMNSELKSPIRLRHPTRNNS